MPRARIPDARSLVTADCLILPFLAPRVFGESPFRRRNGTAPGRAGQEEERKEEVRHSVDWKLHRQPAPSHPSPGTLLVPCPSRARPIRPLGSTIRPVGARYADISFLARQLCASFSTTSGPRKDSIKPIRERRTTRRVDTGASPIRERDRTAHPSSRTKSQRLRKSSRTIHKSGSGISLKGREELRMSARSTRSYVKRANRHGESPLQRSRRIRALRLVHRQLSRLRSFLEARSIDGEELMRDGRFRSLCRRQYIFSRNTKSYVYPRFGISQEFEYFSLNVRGFAALDAKVHPGLNRMSHRILLRHDPECVDRAIELCKGVALLDVETMWLNWQQFDRTERKNWEQLLLFLVHKRPHHALSFIRVLMRGSRMANRRAQAVADSLEHLAMVFLQSEIPDNLIGSKAYFMPTFYYCFRDHFFANRNVCSQALLWSVARLADSSPQLRLIYDLLIEKKAYMGCDTLLHYANKFGQFGDSEYGLRCLQRVVDVATTPKGKADIVDRRRFRWSCALILRRIVKISNGQDYHLTTSLVAEFLKLGVKLDILLYNVIIHNAMDAGDHTTAFRVYNLLEDNRIKPDSYTLSILLHGCTVTDPVQFQDFAEFCARQAKEMNDQYLAAGYLHYLHVRHHDEEPVVLSGIIRRNYREFFRQDALLDVVSMGRSHGSTTISRDSDPFSETEADTVALEGSLMEPPSLALYIILHSAIRKSVSLGTNYVFSIYGRFKAAVLRQQHPALNELALETNIWNAFLYAFCQKQQFADASQLIKSMTDDNRALFPPPDVYSWNIFMQAFFKNDQSRAAERVYDIMRSRGVEPDQYTFGVLLSGFARKQLVEKLGGVLEHMDDEAELHPHILGELAKVHDRRRLMLELEKARIAKERKRREKLIATQKENEKVWEEPIFTIQKYVSGKKK